MLKNVLLNRYKPLLPLFFFSIVLGFILRIVLLCMTSGFSYTPWVLSSSFVLGAFFDSVTSMYVLFPWFLFITCIPSRLLSTSWYKISTYLITLCYTCIYYFVFVAEITFWEEFASRFNFIAVDYLIYTHEVINNIVESYPLAWLLSAIFVVSVVTSLYLIRFYPKKYTVLPKERWAFCTCYMVIIVVSLVVNNRWKNFSTNTLNNSLAGNGIYEFVAAFFNNQIEYRAFYKTIPLQEAVQIVKKDFLREEGVTFIEPLSDLSFRYKRTYKGSQNNLNMVLVIVESLSSKYMSRYGESRNITPFLDTFASQTLFFSNVLATGTRTVRGLEALSLSLPPTPGQSIVRRKNNTGLRTMGNVLKEAGYDTYFYYAGYGYFDNMNAYFSGNAYDVVDRLSIDENLVVFSNAWGIADESLFAAVLRSIDTRKTEKPFFYTVLTTSNHRPFTYPDNRIDIPSGEGRHGAVKYTDWSLQHFIEEAAKKPWFDNTIFVIVADHTAGGAGKTELPLKRYHIPLFIYAPKHIKPREIDTVISQIDIVPTLLGLLNVSYVSSFMGHDVLRMKNYVPRAFVGTYQELGYYENDVLTILEPKGVLFQQKVVPDYGAQITQKTLNTRLADKAVAYYQYASYLFTNGLLRLSDMDTNKSTR